MQDTMSEISGSNNLNINWNCPKCKQPVSSGIGFRAGVVKGLSYKIGDKIDWSAKTTWPAERPDGGNFKTIGYYECENLRCESWSDCFPEVQEVVITIHDDVICSAIPAFYQPDKIDFFVLSPDQEI